MRRRGGDDGPCLVRGSARRPARRLRCETQSPIIAFAAVLMSSGAFARSFGEKIEVNSTLGIYDGAFVKEAGISDMYPLALSVAYSVVFRFKCIATESINSFSSGRCSNRLAIAQSVRVLSQHRSA